MKFAAPQARTSSIPARDPAFRPEAIGTTSQRTLTFADRVIYQHAVEEVYWLHRIWPKETRHPPAVKSASASNARALIDRQLK
jgi:hypothetical protein